MGCQCAKKATDNNADIDTSPLYGNITKQPEEEKEKEKILDEHSVVPSVSEKKKKKKKEKKAEGNKILT
jgi:hypothetical protein